MQNLPFYSQVCNLAALPTFALSYCPFPELFHLAELKLYPVKHNVPSPCLQPLATTPVRSVSEFEGSRGLVGVESNTAACWLSVDLPWFPFCFKLALRILVRVEVYAWVLRRPFGDEGQPPPAGSPPSVSAGWRGEASGRWAFQPVSESAGPQVAPSRLPFPEPVLCSAEMIVALGAACPVADPSLRH